MLNPLMIWLIIGAVLCSLEFIFPTAFMEFMLGLGAVAVAVIVYLVPSLDPNVQIFLWLLFSTIAIVSSRRFFTPKTSIRTISDAADAETLTAIAPGEAGRVLYEGNSWRARCADETVTIDPHQTVYVLRREGTTLIVMPRHLLEP
ncbi:MULTISPECIES: NfeD family protein [Cyanophyceae]|uniref:NfeD family protein n=1 Tax=Cyanophyceae TaxID=3028117 RepID=UPI00016DCDFE|nr:MULTISPECIES: NfeD family protein [Cyanophyceae]ACB00563.1 nodulation efficiency protein D (NfeD) [Picosynechococcus sp. PCC 7002]SMH50370.1 Membrane protein implicated in regulation of membrane protease activity [Picosynechococcus sp. OG1]SMQ81812.1 Membrane protein implicated in regulation of membrane protease activity [Synechococcus sp. 7002]